MRIKHVYCNISFRTCVKSKHVDSDNSNKNDHYTPQCVYTKLGPTLLIESKILQICVVLT